MVKKTGQKKISFYLNENISEKVDKIAELQGRTNTDLYREGVIKVIKEYPITEWQNIKPNKA